MDKKKVLQSVLLSVMLVFTTFSWGTYKTAKGSQDLVSDVSIEALEVSGEASTVSDDVSDEGSSEGIIANSEETTSNLEELTEVVDSTDNTTAVTENTEDSFEVEFTEEAEVIAPVSGDVTTEIEAIEESSEETTEIVNGAVIVEKQDSVLSREAINIVVKNPAGSTTWGGGHWYWMVGTAYAFCLDKGYTMSNGTWSAEKVTEVYGSVLRSYQINTAIKYYLMSAGNSFNATAYQKAQYAIWGDEASDDVVAKINAYAKYSKKICEDETKIGSFKKVTAKQAANGTGSLLTKTVTSNSVTFSPSNDAWKYFAAGNQETDANGNWTTSSAGKYGDLVGNPDKGAYVYTSSADIKAKATVASDGKVTISVTKNGAAYTLGQGEWVKVYLKVVGDLMGSGIVSYFETPEGIQNLVSESTGNSVYFGVKLIGESTEDAQYPSIQVNKMNPFGDTTDATFGIKWKPFDSSGVTLPAGSVDGQGYVDTGFSFSANEVYELESVIAIHDFYYPATEGRGHYAIYEKSANGLYTDPSVNYHGIMVGAVPGGDNVMYYFLYNTGSGDAATLTAPWTALSNWTDATYLGKRPNAANLASATITNYFPTGSYEFIKTANTLVKCEEVAPNVRMFRYEMKPSSEASFTLYAASDIYVGGRLFRLANEEIPKGVWCTTQAGCDIQYNNVPDADGKIRVTGLPPGDYYFRETDAGPHYLKNESIHAFSVVSSTGTTADGEIYINSMTATGVGNGSFVNHPLSAKVSVYKYEVMSADGTKKPLAGANFWLYAKVTNTDFNGNRLFADDEAEDAVISRDNETGAETTESGWVKICLMTSDANGFAEPMQDLPYGDYLVVETKAPEGYSLPEESWKFTHSKGAYASVNEYSNSIDYSHSFNFYDEPKELYLEVVKYGPFVRGTKDVTSDYGTYKQIVTEEGTLAGIKFAIYNENDEIVDTLVTDEYGKARSINLPPGKYWVQETWNPEIYKLDETKQEVELNWDDPVKTIEMKSIKFNNELVSTKFHFYKTGEVSYETQKVLANPTAYPGITVKDNKSAYTWNQESLEGAVIGVYAKEDLINYFGDVIIKAGDCVGFVETDEYGKGTLNELLLPGLYQYKEIIAPANFKLNESSFNFEVKTNHEDIDLSVNENDPIINKHTKSAIKLIKKDSVSEKLLAGVEFQLWADYDTATTDDDSLLGTYITDANGEIQVTDLPLGTYYFKETLPLDGYYPYTEKIVYEVNQDGMLFTIEAYNDEIPDEPEDNYEEPLMPGVPKLGAFDFVDIFCSVLVLVCIAGLVIIWAPKKRR